MGLVPFLGPIAAAMKVPSAPSTEYRYWGVGYQGTGSINVLRTSALFVSVGVAYNVQSIPSADDLAWWPDAPSTGGTIAKAYVDSSTYFSHNASGSASRIFYADMGTPVEADFVSFRPANSLSHMPTHLKVYASNNLSTWDEMTSWVSTTGWSAVLTPVYTKP